MDILIASKKHIKYANIISETIESSAKARDTGIALRTPDYIVKKIENKNAIICLDGDKFVGFCYIEITERGGVIVYGRSDTVLNPGGVRIGTSEIYRPVEEMIEIGSKLELLAIA